MAYVPKEKLMKLNFKYLGSNVKISDKASIYNPEKMIIGDNSRIDDFCVISGKVIIGRNVHITALCLVAGGDVGVEFEDFSALAYRTTVFTQSDDYSGKYMTNPTLPSRYTKCTARKVKVGKHSIVGANSVVLPGSIIGEGASIGVNSTVKGRIRKWGIYSGNPLVHIRERNKNLLILEKEYLKEDI